MISRLASLLCLILVGQSAPALAETPSDDGRLAVADTNTVVLGPDGAPLLLAQYYQPYPQRVYVYPPRPRHRRYWVPQVGLGVRVMGGWNINGYTNSVLDSGGFGQGGIGGELLVRMHPHLSLEVTAQYMGTGAGTNYEYGFFRSDIPLTVGLRIHLGNPFWWASPYLVVAAGADRGHMEVDDGGPALLVEEAWFFDGQFGGGVEFRVGRHFAITLDGRFVGLFRDTNNAVAVTGADLLGQPVDVPIMGNQFGMHFNLGLAGYF